MFFHFFVGFQRNKERISWVVISIECNTSLHITIYMIVYGYVSKFFMAPKNDQVPKINRAHTDFWDTAILTKHSSFTPFIHPLPLEDSNNGPLLSKSCCHHWHLKDQLLHKRQQIWWSREIVYDVYNWYIHIYSLYIYIQQIWYVTMLSILKPLK